VIRTGHETEVAC